MKRNGGPVFPAHANPGDPNGPVRGLSANENARALISIMARSTNRSNQRPDTLMQDRLPPAQRNLLATHGRTIHVGHRKRSRQHKDNGRSNPLAPDDRRPKSGAA